MKIKYICNRCGNGIYKSRGWNKTKTKREFRCSNCGKNITLSFRQVEELKHDKIKQNNPKILIFDLETSPLVTLVWGLWKQRISPESVVKGWAILSWSAKWLFDSEIMGESVSSEEACNREDKSIITGLWELINSADIIIAHNAIQFDSRKMNARFILNKLPPPMPYIVIDTLKESRKWFAFSSHKLDYLGQLLVNKQKIETDYKLWKRCIGMYGEKEASAALTEMLTYCKGDVALLEEVYVKIRPWLKPHPNTNLYYSDIKERCPNCGSAKLEEGGFYYTPAGRFQTFRCECGAICRSRSSDLSKNERNSLLRAIAR